MPDSPSESARLADLEARWERDQTSRVFVQLAEELRRRGDLDRALAVLEKGLEHHPSYVPAEIVHARCRLERGEAAAAREILEDVVGRDPTQIVANRLLLESYLDLGERERAEEALERYRLLGAGSDETEPFERRLDSLASRGDGHEDEESFVDEGDRDSEAVGSEESLAGSDEPATGAEDRAAAHRGERGPEGAPDDELFRLPSVRRRSPLSETPERDDRRSLEVIGEDRPFALGAAAGGEGTVGDVFALPRVAAPRPPSAEEEGVPEHGGRPPEGPAEEPSEAPTPVDVEAAPAESSSLEIEETVSAVEVGTAGEPELEGEAAEPSAVAETSPEAAPPGGEQFEEETVDMRPSAWPAGEHAVREEEAAEKEEPEGPDEAVAGVPELTGTGPIPTVGGEREEVATPTLAALYLRQGYLDEAEALYREVLAEDPDSTAAREGLETIALRRQEPLTAGRILASSDEEAEGVTARKILVLRRYAEILRGGDSRGHVRGSTEGHQ